MKFPLGFEIELARPGGAAYADITHGADRYVVGVPAQPFEVRVTAPATQLTTQVMVHLSVDGNGVGMAKLLSSSQPVGVFSGSVSAIKGQNITRQFLFGKAETRYDTQPSAPSANKTGGVVVTFTAVKEVPGQVHHSAPTPQQTASASQAVEGKKWFMQPSLSAQHGKVVGTPITYSTKKYNNIRILATCEMRMETAAILVLRKVLNPDFPPHKAIIDRSSTEPDEQEEEEGSSNQNVSAAANTAAMSSARTGIKRERSSTSSAPSRAIKKEPSGKRGFANEDSGVIDLT